MRRFSVMFVVAIAVIAGAALAGQTPAGGPYKVLQRAKVGGEGGTDYIYADSVGRRLYITRGATPERPATDTTPAVPAFEKRTTIFDLDTLAPVGTMAGIQGNGVAVCPATGHGFTSDMSMFDVKTMKLIKTIAIPPPATPDAPAFRGDGILCDTFNNRVYIGSHPTKSLMVVDAKDGTVLGNVDLGGTPEQTVADGKGTLYQVLQERPGGVAVVDAKTMKVTATYSFGDAVTGNGGCNGLALDAKNGILFAACSQVGAAPARGTPAPPADPNAKPPQAFVIMSAKDGKILARLPLAGSSDGATFNPETMEAFSTNGNGTLTIVKEKSPTTFEVEQNLDTMVGARTIAFDSKTGHLFAMSVERGPVPPPPPPPPAGTAPTGRGGQAPVIPGSFTILMIGK
jgi:outer membrane protein assembly factor BamB